MTAFYNISKSEIFKLLNTKETGLTSQSASVKLKESGYNVLPSKQSISLWQRLVNQFKDFLIGLLIVAALISLAFGEIIDASAILVIVIVNALIGFIQEYKAEQALAALKKQEKDTVKVYRNNQLKVMDSKEIVPGDLLLIEAGDTISADCRVLQAFSLKVNEAALTGESIPVTKQDRQIIGKVVIAEQINMLFRGTSVIEGKAKVMVVKTGLHTEIGKIAGMLSREEKEPTPLQKELTDIGKKISLVVLVIAALVFFLLVFKEQAIIDSFLTAVALSVAAIPEGLPAIVAVVLSVGVLKLARKQTIIRTLKAVETLGSVKYLLTDKTGTLTWNKINVVRVAAANKAEFKVKGEGYQNKGEYLNENSQPISHKEKNSLQMLMTTGIICNNAELEFEGQQTEVIGDTTEGALLVSAERMGIKYQALRQNYEIIDEQPFSSESKRMLSLVMHKETKKYYLLIKGAPEVVISMCAKADTKYWLNKVSAWAKNGWRLLSFAYLEIDKKDLNNYAKYLSQLKYLGLVAEEDTVRAEAIEAVEKAKKAGIETIMITGDHMLAAFSIAKQVGIAQSLDQVINGINLDNIDDELLLSKLLLKTRPIRVFARVSPEQKLRIVNLIKDKTQSVVAVTGDGVNDAPSIKAANVGVAMGITGSDVTKEVADVILADDNYATLVTGIFQGRVIFDNLIRFIRYLLSCNIGEILVVFLGTLSGQLHILLPIQILFINLATDSLPALALGFEKGTSSVMHRPPRDTSEAILNWRRWKSIIIEGFLIGGITLYAFYYFLPQGFAYARTVAFVVLILTQLLHSINSRDEHLNMFQIGPFSNQMLILAIVVSFGLTILATQFGLFELIFKTVPIKGVLHWLLIIAFSSVVLVVSGIRKLLKFW